eukprot:436592-Amphidinium_carterae.1
MKSSVACSQAVTENTPESQAIVLDSTRRVSLSIPQQTPRISKQLRKGPHASIAIRKDQSRVTRTIYAYLLPAIETFGFRLLRG